MNSLIDAAAAIAARFEGDEETTAMEKESQDTREKVKVKQEAIDDTEHIATSTKDN